MTSVEALVMIAVTVIATVITRAVSFLVFSEKRQLPKFVSYLGGVLPGAMFGLLVVYCLKSVSLTSFPFGIPELVASAVVIGIHLWRRSLLLSVLCGTVVYMALVQLVIPMLMQ